MPDIYENAKAPEPPPVYPFTFRLQGHGMDVPVGVYHAENEHKAFAMAFKACKSFELPGWTLVCVESGTRQGAVEFVDHTRESKRGGPAKQRA